MHRFGLWLTICTLVAAQVQIFTHLIHRYVFKSHTHGQLISKAIAVMVTILAVATELHVLKFTPILPRRIDPPLEFLAFVWLPITVISVIFILLHRVLGQLSVSKSSMENDVTVDNKSAAQSADALPEWRKSKTLRVQVEDHYLRIFNQNRQFFIRGKMSEAIELLEATEGVRVHRSHWVSFEHINEIQKEGRDYHLKLNKGDQVPVSRARANEVRKSLEAFNGMLKK